MLGAAATPRRYHHPTPSPTHRRSDGDLTRSDASSEYHIPQKSDITLCTETGLTDANRGDVWVRLVLGPDVCRVVPPLADFFIRQVVDPVRLGDAPLTPTHSRCLPSTDTEFMKSSTERRGRVLPRCRAHSLALTRVTRELPRESPRRSLKGSRSLSSSYRLPENCQPRVVAADIQRSLWSLYPVRAERDLMRLQLKNMLLRIFAHNPTRHYYQGLHELLGFVMYVMQSTAVPTETVSAFCQELLVTRLRCFTMKKLRHTEALLYAMHSIIAKEDPKLAAALEKCGVGPESHYTVSWVMTWYVHSLKSIPLLSRLLDYFLVEADGLNVILFTAAFIVHSAPRIHNIIADSEAEEQEMVNSETANLTVMAEVYAQLLQLPNCVLETMSPDEVNTVVHMSSRYRELHMDVVEAERKNFLAGSIRPLGILASQGTRNAALQLLSHLLPREWRNPVKQRAIGHIMIGAVVLLALGVAMVSKSNHLWYANW